MMLYKYRSLSTHKDPNGDGTKSPKDYTLELLKNNEFYFSSPDQFNDPFDCYMPITFAKGKANWRKQTEYLASHTNSDKKLFIERLMTVGEYLNFDPLQTPLKNAPDYVKTFSQNIKKLNLQNAFRIYSLSAKKDNMLMWAHYGDSFRGICLGFSAFSLADQGLPSFYNIKFENIINNSTTLTLLQQKSAYCGPVHYASDNKLPAESISIINEFNSSELLHLLSTKYKEWIYENEFRLIFPQQSIHKASKGTNKLNFDKNILKDVIFGFDCEAKNKEEIKNIVKEKYQKTKFYNCIRKPGEYGVIIEPDD